MPTISNDQVAGVPEEEFYDGEDPANVTRLFEGLQPADPASSPARPKLSQARYVAIINVALGVLAARLLCLLAVIGAVAMWGFAVWEPELMRTYAAIGFSVTVLMPLVVVMWRRG